MKELKIKYLKKFESWQNIEGINDFHYPWRSESPPTTNFKAYHNEDGFYFKYVAEGPQPLVYIKDNHKLEVIHSERIEIFFRKDEKLNPYYCFEIDPHGRVLDYEATHYRKFNRAWTWPGDLQIKTKMEDGFYTVEGRFEKSILHDLGLLEDNNLQVGLYRGHCTSLINDQSIIKWISWVDSESEKPDFHIASSFGALTLLSKYQS